MAPSAHVFPVAEQHQALTGSQQASGHGRSHVSYAHLHTGVAQRGSDETRPSTKAAADTTGTRCDGWNPAPASNILTKPTSSRWAAGENGTTMARPAQTRGKAGSKWVAAAAVGGGG